MFFSSGPQLVAAINALPDSANGKVGDFLAFDALNYSNIYMLNGNTTGMTAIEHFIQFGAPAMAWPNLTFDPVFYKQNNADLSSNTGLDAADLLYHFLKFGLGEGRPPNANLADTFDADAYLAAYPDVAAYVNANLADFNGSASNGALAHYVKFGMAQGFELPEPAAPGTTFTLTDSTLGTAPAALKVMNLSGDQDVRIDMTNKTSQITGLDLNGNGSIANDGAENATNVHTATGYAAVDAYTRLTNGVVNESNLANVFLGDIKYDGTGFAGDGKTTNGNVVLGGLGVDTILGGIGNDFLAAGGVALSRDRAALAQWVAEGHSASSYVAPTETVSGGRNADFIFAELSLLSNTDGNKLFIDGGATADNTSAANGQSTQDSDWLLLQASDDDERIEVNLTENAGTVGTTVVNDGTLTTRAGQYATLRDIENLDASGNTYGFIKGLTAIGGAPVNANNNGIGSSGQLNVNGSAAANIIIGGYDNDAINGGDGNDILMGGNMKSYGADYRVALGANNVATQQLLDPNLVGLTGNNDGRDELIGGTGADNIVFEADGGIIEGGAEQNVDDTPVDTLWLTANSLGAVAAAGSVTPVAAETLITDINPKTLVNDAVIRLDLAVGKEGGLANAHGYGGADLDAATGKYTADQTNYNTASAGLRVQVQDMENVIATGLGAIDYKAAGGNSAADVTFSNQQNFLGYNGNLDLRGTYSTEKVTVSDTSKNADGTDRQIAGTIDPSATTKTVSPDGLITTTVDYYKANGSIVDSVTKVTKAGSDGANILYAGTGNDVIEGRTGGAYTFNLDGSVIADTRDKLSGNDGIDTFIFGTMDGITSVNSVSGQSGHSGHKNGEQSTYGDNIDVIWRQSDVNAADKLAGKGADNLWDGVSYERDFGIGSATSKTASGLKLTLNVSAADTTSNPLVQNDVRAIEIKVAGADVVLTTADMAAAPTMAALLTQVQAALVTHGDADLSATLTNNTITIIDAAGRVLGGTGYLVVQNSGGSIQNDVKFEQSLTNTVGDVILYTSYEDRLDAELTNDSSFNGSTISLGEDSYAQDRVVSFSDNNGKIQTRIAEDQSYTLKFNNLTTQDTVTISVNGVQYQLTVGKELDGTSIAAEDGVGDSQASIQEAFLVRLDKFINSFMDANTAAGQVQSELNADGDTLTLSQATYHKEETVFMKEPLVTLTNGSGGQPATVVLANTAQHEVLLYEFNGRDNGINAANVKFIGSTGINQSTLETAKDAGQTLIGNEAVVVDGGKDDLVGTVTNNNTPLAALTLAQSPVATIANNTNTNSPLQGANFSVHGDDLLIGGKGNDTIYGRTGDDRVIGSLGTDVADGGKDWYAVKVLGEAQARVVEMNLWEAASPAARVAALTGLTLTSTTQIDQNQSGFLEGSVDPLVSVNNDTLLFQQADFGEKARFTVTLDDYTVVAGVVNLTHGGAGHVGIDADGDKNLDVGQVTAFTNFENIRTVSGTGFAVAGNGQGNDTLNVSALSKDTKGVSYNLTNVLADQGKVMYSVDALIVAPTVTGLVHSVAAEYESLVMAVDGVENVIGGLGDDLLTIDETEAAKDNRFDADAGNDRIDYTNDYNLGDALLSHNAEPQVAIKVLGLGSETVTMTGGRVAAAGSAGAVDTLTGVEFITLGGNTAQGIGESDVLDVSALATGSTVNYLNGTVKNAAGVNQVVIEHLYEVENVVATAGNDTVIVASASVMGQNGRSDTVAAGLEATATKDIAIATFLDYDEFAAAVTPSTATPRVVFAKQNATMISDTLNQNQFTFDMTSSATDKDTIDYSQATDNIAAVINFAANDNNKYVLVGVNFSSAGIVQATNSSLTDTSDRIDHLIGVEQIVASQGKSIIDVTNSGQDTNVLFSDGFLPTTPVSDQEVHQVRVEKAADKSAVGNVTLLEYRDTQAVSVANPLTLPTAVWTGVEGSDFGDYVQLTGYEANFDHTINLRGGVNEVNYNERTRGIELQINNVDLNTGTPKHQYDLKVVSLDTSGAPTANFDLITGYNTLNTVSSGTMRIEASQGKFDNIVVNTGTDNLFLMGLKQGNDDVINVLFGTTTVGMVLSGFENLKDAATNDTYEIDNLANFAATLTLKDNAAADSDTIKLVNASFGTALISPPISHTITIDKNLFMGDGVADSANDLQWLGLDSAGATRAAAAAGNDTGFDFKNLDISAVTTPTAITATGSNAGVGAVGTLGDKIVLGDLTVIDGAGTAINGFDTLALTNASAGTSFKLNLDANELQTSAGLKIFGYTGDNIDVSAITGRNMTITVVDVAGNGAVVTGSAGIDTITGGAGNDKITGGAGADLLDGGFVAEKAEVQKFVLSGNWGTAGVEGVSTTSDSAVIFDGFTVTENTTVRGTLVPAGANAGQIGSAIVREWLANPASFTNSTAISSITYDTGTQAIVVTYKTTGVDISNTLLTVTDTNGTDANTLSIGAASITEWVPRTESNDTFVYLKAADSTAAAMDVISNFTIDGTAATNDIIDISAITNATMGAMTFVDAFDWALAPEATGYAALEVLATAAFAAAAADGVGNLGANMTWGYAGSTGTNTVGDSYLFVDADQSGTIDGVIKLAGVAHNTFIGGGFDGSNLNYL